MKQKREKVLKLIKQLHQEDYITIRECYNILEKNNLKTCISTIRKYYKLLNLKLEGSGGKNRKVQNNPFIPLTEESYYWLGFIAADGHVNKYQVRLKIKDIDHIVKYRDFINPNLKLFDSINTANNKMRLVYFGNKETIKFLNNIGITSSKTKSLKIDNNILNNRHFLRGFFDGDGSAKNYEVKITTASIKFRDQLLLLLKNLKIQSYYRIKGVNKDCYDVLVKSRESKKRLFNYFYKDSNIYLERKYNDYAALVRKYQ